MPLGRESDHEAQVGNEVGEAELSGRAGEAHRADERPSQHFWVAKTCSMATRTGARAALPRARCGCIGRRRASGAELRHQAAPRQQRDVGRRAACDIGPDRPCGVVAGEQLSELAAVVRRAIGDRKAGR